MAWLLPLLLAAGESEATAAVASSFFSSHLTRLASDCSLLSWSPFCRLVGREAETEAWAASRWRGLATTAAAGEERGAKFWAAEEVAH